MAKHMDLTGQRFGRLVAVERLTERNEQGEYPWLCRCDCGTETVVRFRNLRRGMTKSCGCQRAEWAAKHAGGKGRMPQVNDSMAGMRFGRLLVTERVTDRKWKGRCDCGTERTFTRSQLASGSYQSCGCGYADDLKRRRLELERRLSAEAVHKAVRVDITGQRFGLLTVLDYVGHLKFRSMWRVRCDCGTTFVVASVSLAGNVADKRRTYSCGLCTCNPE